MLEEANALATRVSKLEQIVPDTYQSMIAEATALGLRVATLENTALPSKRVTASDFELLGGWRIRQEFARGGLAIDWTMRRLFSSGHSNENIIHEYQLPDSYGTGPDVLQWPELRRVRTHQNFWGDEPGGWGHGWSGGIQVKDGILWVSPKVYYDSAPKRLVIYGKDLLTGEKHRIATTLQSPAFGGGFVKGKADMLLGCGGYESGQGAVYGPTLAKLDSTILLNQPSLNEGTWENRTPRPPNYFVEPGEPSWLGMNPRNGEGRWCSDRVYGGGLWLDRGLCYWPILGTGSLAYKYQTEMFSIGENKEGWFYTYDPTSLAKSSVKFEKWPHGQVNGCEVGPDGLVYLHTRNEWASYYKVDPAVKIFKVKN